MKAMVLPLATQGVVGNGEGHARGPQQSRVDVGSGLGPIAMESSSTVPAGAGCSQLAASRPKQPETWPQHEFSCRPN